MEIVRLNCPLKNAIAIDSLMQHFIQVKFYYNALYPYARYMSSYCMYGGDPA